MSNIFFVNFTWLVFLSNQKFNAPGALLDFIRFKPEAFWFTAILNSLKTNILVRLKTFLL